jgi:hemerythrin superfamily protein
MLEEHKAIRAAVQKLARVAGQEKKTEQEQFARDLALHAQTEEQVLYPAAVLVANLIRARAAD